MPIALIHLVSEQPMPNLLASLAIKPDLCVHVVSPGSRRHERALAAAINDACPATAIETLEAAVEPGKAAPSGAEIRRLVAETASSLASRGYSVVVNVTGGTKPMSLGALVGAGANKAQVVYVESPDNPDEPLLIHPTEGTASGFPADWRDSRRVRDLLSVRLIALAHGVRLVADPRAPERLVATACALGSLHIKTREELRKAIPVAPGRKPDDFLALADTPLHFTDETLEVEREALAAGLIERRAGRLFLALPDNERALLRELAADAKTGKIEPEAWRRRINAGSDALVFRREFLGGGHWFEILVWNHLRQNPRFRDVLWSPRETVGAAAEVEEDILAVEGYNLACVSCKLGTTGSGLLSAVSDLDARARHLGGSRAAKYLALGAAPQNIADLLSHARPYGVRLIGDSRTFLPAASRSPFEGFAPPRPL